MRWRQAQLRAIREGAPPRAEKSLKPLSEEKFDPRFYRVDQLAEILQVSRQSVVRWFRARAVIVRARSRETILIPREAFHDWIKEHSAN